MRGPGACALLVRALAREAAHVVLTTRPGPETDILMAELAARLEASDESGGSACVVRLAASGAGSGALCARILQRAGRPPGSDRDLLALCDSLVGEGRALVLLVRDANQLSNDALHRLGRLAEASRGGLRVGLFVELDGRPEGEAVDAIRTGLGLRPSPRHVSLLRPAPATKPLPASSRSGRRWRRGAVAAAGLLAVGLLGVWLGDAPVPAVSSTEVPAVASRPPKWEHEKMPIAVLPPIEAPSLRTRSEPPVPEVLAIEPPTPEPVAAPPPPPAPRIHRVSLNARPWAEIEIDGKSVGVTPLGDLAVTAGRHHFRAIFPDGRVVEREVRVGANGRHLVF